MLESIKAAIPATQSSSVRMMLLSMISPDFISNMQENQQMQLLQEIKEFQEARSEVERDEKITKLMRDVDEICELVKSKVNPLIITNVQDAMEYVRTEQNQRKRAARSKTKDVEAKTESKQSEVTQQIQQTQPQQPKEDGFVGFNLDAVRQVEIVQDDKSMGQSQNRTLVSSELKEEFKTLVENRDAQLQKIWAMKDATQEEVAEQKRALQEINDQMRLRLLQHKMITDFVQRASAIGQDKIDAMAKNNTLTEVPLDIHNTLLSLTDMTRLVAYLLGPVDQISLALEDRRAKRGQPQPSAENVVVEQKTSAFPSTEGLDASNALGALVTLMSVPSALEGTIPIMQSLDQLLMQSGRVWKNNQTQETQTQTSFSCVGVGEHGYNLSIFLAAEKASKGAREEERVAKEAKEAADNLMACLKLLKEKAAQEAKEKVLNESALEQPRGAKNNTPSSSAVVQTRLSSQSIPTQYDGAVTTLTKLVEILQDRKVAPTQRLKTAQNQVQQNSAKLTIMEKLEGGIRYYWRKFLVFIGMDSAYSLSLKELSDDATALVREKQQEDRIKEIRKNVGKHPEQYRPPAVHSR